MLRTDSLASLYFFHPLARSLKRTGVRVPILMYHSVSDGDRSGTHPYYQTVTSPSVFARHMQFLSENGFTPVGVGDVLNYLNGSTQTVERPVAITFDDGYRDFYTDAFSILDRYGFTATMYLPTAYIGATEQRFKGLDCLTWGQVRELHAFGIEFGAHTVTHPQLQGMRQQEIENEISDSKRRIEDELQCPVRSFAYPYAFPETDHPFKQRLRASLERSGYEHGVSTILGTADSTGDRFFMRRLPVNSCDDAKLFRAKLEGGYDWLHGLQYAAKWMKSPATRRSSLYAVGS